MTWEKRPSLESTQIPTDFTPDKFGIFSISGNLLDAEQVWNVGEKVVFCILPQVTGSTASSFHLDSSRSSSLFGDLFHKSCKKFFLDRGAVMTVTLHCKSSRAPVRQVEVKRICFDEFICFYLLTLLQSVPQRVTLLILALASTVCNRRVYLNSDQLFRGLYLDWGGYVYFWQRLLKMKNFTPLALLSHSPQHCIPLFKVFIFFAISFIS